MRSEVDDGAVLIDHMLSSNQRRRSEWMRIGAQGVLVTLAIGLHNVPEGLAVATTLVARGVMPRQALLWCETPSVLRWLEFLSPSHSPAQYTNLLVATLL